MSRTTRSRLVVAGITAGLLTGIFAVSWAVAGLIGTSWERPEPEPRPTREEPPWYGDLFGGDGS